MARRLFYTFLSLVLSGAAFASADPAPDVNLFGVLFLFFAYIVWFYWKDIEAGYAYLEERRAPGWESSGLMFIRFAPMYLRELTSRRRRR